MLIQILNFMRSKLYLKRSLSLLIAILLLTIGVFAQQAKVAGNVMDSESQETLPGVSVFVKGTKTASITDANGKFIITAAPGTTLVFTYIGYKSIEAPAKSGMSIRLVATANSLKEVVVTAFGIKREARAIGYAITSINGEELTKAGSTENPLTALYGKAAGVGIQVGSAGPTGGVNIKIRGSGSLSTSQNARPLFVVDGVPIYDENTNMQSRGYDPLNSFDYGTGINDLNGDDIESIDILKGAKASILYGSKAGNGVIMITTKKGKTTRGLGVSLSYQNITEQPVSYIDWQNEFGSGASIYDTAHAVIKGKTARKLNSSRIQFGPAFDGKPIMGYDSVMRPYQAYPNNWIDLFKKTYTSVTTAAIQGANEKGSMRLSFTNKNYKGEMKNFFQKDNSVSFNGQMNASDLASFEIVANLHQVKTQNRYPNVGRLVSYGFNRDIDYKLFDNMYKDALGQKTNYENLGLPTSVSDATGYLNMLWNQNQNINLDDKLHFTGAIKFNLKFTPYLSLTGQAGVDYTNWNFTKEYAVTQIIPTIQGGSYGYSTRNTVVQNYNTFLNFNKRFLNDQLEVVAFGGPDITRTTDNTMGVNTVGGLQFPNWWSVDATSSTTGNFNQSRNLTQYSELTSSLLGSVSFGWKSIFYLELSARNDWSSTLPPKNNSYFYPGASFSWNFSDSYKIPKMTYGKFRVSLADIGKGAPGGYFAYPSSSVGRIPNSGAVTVTGPSSLFIGDLLPERKRELEFGFDTRWFDKTPLEVDISYYYQNNYNQIMALNLTNSTGFPNIKLNAGQVQHWGIEFFTKFTPILTKNMKWDISFNTSPQYSKVIKLYPGITSYTVEGSGSYSIMANEGQKQGDVQMFDYLRDPNGTKIVSSSGTYSADNKKLVTVANINPKFFGGFQTNLFYKSFNLSMAADFKFGGTFLSYSNYYLLGNGQTKATLQYRDEKRGGLAYYTTTTPLGDKMIPWQHNQAAPAASNNGIVYHDGLILPGVKVKTDLITGAPVNNPDGTPVYVTNDNMITAANYWGQYIHDMSEWFQPDNLVKNDYIKLREVSLSYTLPKSFVEKLKFQKIAVSLVARNLFYLYKTIPNVDPESALGSDVFVEYSPLPAMRSYGFKIDLSF